MGENSEHPAKIPLRRESSNRTIKKPVRELPGEQDPVIVSTQHTKFKKDIPCICLCVFMFEFQYFLFLKITDMERILCLKYIQDRPIVDDLIFYFFLTVRRRISGKFIKDAYLSVQYC